MRQAVTQVVCGRRAHVGAVDQPLRHGEVAVVCSEVVRLRAILALQFYAGHALGSQLLYALDGIETCRDVDGSLVLHFDVQAHSLRLQEVQHTQQLLFRAEIDEAIGRFVQTRYQLIFIFLL